MKYQSASGSTKAPPTLTPSANSILQQAAINRIRSEVGRYESPVPAVSASQFGHDFSRISLHGMPLEMVQPKLAISQPTDPAEREADRVADEVMRMPMSSVAAASPTATVELGQSSRPVIHRQVDKSDPFTEPTEQEDVLGNDTETRVFMPQRPTKTEEGEQEETTTVQRKETADHAPTVSSDSVGGLRMDGGAGSRLPEPIRTDMGHRFGANFSAIRIHADQRSDALCKSIAARAFTHKNHLYFAANEYVPSTMAGRHLLAHELTHAIQQSAVAGAGRATGPEARLSSTVSPSVIQRTIDTSILGASFGLGSIHGAIPLTPGLVARDMENTAFASFGERNPVMDMDVSDWWYYFQPPFSSSVEATRSRLGASLATLNPFRGAQDTYHVHFNYANTATRQRQGSFSVASGASRSVQVTITGGAKLTIGKLEVSGSASQQTTSGSTSQTSVTATNFYEHDYDVSIDYAVTWWNSSDFSSGFFGVSQDSGPHRIAGSKPIGSVTVYDDDSNADNLTP